MPVHAERPWYERGDIGPESTVLIAAANARIVSDKRWCHAHDRGAPRGKTIAFPQKQRSHFPWMSCLVDIRLVREGSEYEDLLGLPTKFTSALAPKTLLRV